MEEPLEAFLEALLELDADIVIWLNRGIGRVALLDYLGYLVVSDYFVPLMISFWLLALWFSGKDPAARDRNQRAVLRAAISLGFANLVVIILNQHFFRDRPFTQYELANLLYEPTDSSFPANPAAISFGAAMGVWLGNRWAGLVLFGLSALWGFTRVYSGVFYPTDVLAGALIGVAVACAAALVLRLMEPLPTWVLKGIRFLHLA
jgi:undecaprenyl-diphosphatase